ncbi:amino acid adenylation domain-containing protein [Paenibacillus sp. HJL G12]|uniref:Amino acid adenylation domain-containing protein n=1 Tax=Paenibacillus dendrobii TaxID=2691084 RepID=A0A7X3IET4_9BACL|nr:non-ribosomal peptide synthetase [Paenibacillus dendrobii]MWV42597.1 amino acid adenylation domain-containing protein [Paenibacillus dendrobii]
MFQLDMLDTKKNTAGRKGRSGGSVSNVSLKDIAIVGISAKLPRAESHEAFWELLRDGKDLVGGFPDSRKVELKPYLRRMEAQYGSVSFFDGAYIEDISGFDYSFFRLSPKEASLMSPAQRLFLQTAWGALENAGYGGDALHGSRTGVFIGYNGDALHDYKRIIEALDPDALSMAAPGNLSSMIPSRISYLLNLRGPAISVDTACSSSLVAIHLACQSIRSGECEAAIAGSVKINVLPLDTGIRLGIESSDNRARTFDDSADGTGIGDGVVALLLKPLSRAQEDGDHIYAVIKGSAVNQDGSSVGITAPNALAQEDVIVRAWQDADIDPETITYMEAHGTGTSLGDPIEIDGLTRAFRRYTDKRQFCAISSLKTNIGHLDHAAGIAGLLKAILSLVHKQLPPTLHYRSPNRNIPFVDSPVYVNDELTPWETDGGARRCGVSAFGMSGTNCHVVLEEAPAGMPSDRSNRAELFCLSAHSMAALERLVILMRDWTLQHRGDENRSLADLCYTLVAGRGAHQYRLAIAVSGWEELAQTLHAVAESGFTGLALPNGRFGTADADTTGNMRQQSIPNEREVEVLELGQRYVSGYEIDWKEIYRGQRRYRMPLPTYPFDSHRCWVEEARDGAALHTPFVAWGGYSFGGDIPEELRQEMNETFARWQAALELSGGMTSQRRRGVALTGERSGLEWEQHVADVWGELLGYDELPTTAGYYELGGDSIIALKIANRLSELAGVRIQAADLLGHADLPSFTALIERRIRESGAATAQITNARHDGRGADVGSGGYETNGGHDAQAADGTREGAETSGGYVGPLTGQASGALSGDKLEPIPKAAPQEHYPVSSPQKRMYLQQQAMPDDRSYNLPELLHLDGVIDADRLEAVLQAIVERHETLRTTFHVIDGEIRQRIHAAIPLSLIRLEVDEAEADGVLQSLFRPFRLDTAPLLRAALLTLGPDRHVLFLDMHHIASDGMSAGILLSDLMTLYQGGSLPSLPLQYKDYAVWQENRPLSGNAEQYWRKQCQGDWPLLALPTDAPRPPVKGNRGETFDVYVEAGLTAAVRSLAAESGATPFMVLLSAYYTFLAHYTGAEDIAVGTPIAGRNRRELEAIAGMFTGTLALRAYPRADKPFRAFLSEVKEITTGAYAHADYPFEEIAQWMDRRDASRSPLFDTMFIMQNLGIPNASHAGLSYRHQRFEHGTAKYDLMIQAVETGSELRLVVEYNADLFRRATAERFMRHYVQLLRSVTLCPDAVLGEAEMLTEEERLQMLALGRHEADFPPPRCLHDCFKEQAAAVPDLPAVSCGGESMTYLELDRRTDALARTLRAQGVGSGSVVGIMAERSIPMLTAMLAVMKAGGAYMPIDPHYPEERIRYMLEDSGAELVFADDACSGAGAVVPTSLQVLNISDETLFSSEDHAAAWPQDANDPMYVIYTSGSTGQPKGVIVPHRSFYNFGHSLRTFFEGKYGEKDRCLSLTNISFDVSVAELFMPLMFGACTVLYPEPKLLDPRRIAEVITEERITFAYLPPSLLKEVARLLEQSVSAITLDKMLVGVEPIKDETLELYTNLNPEIQIINGYGPTETTVCSNMYAYKPGAYRGGYVPIGGPMHNVENYIFGYGGQLAPIGAAGELYIAGSGLSGGYVNKPEMTAERFLPHPYHEGRFMYRTGDIAKWLPDGNAMYVDRADQQVKIRGVRIEMNEVRSQLISLPEVEDAVVVVREEASGDKELCAYVIASDKLPSREWRRKLKDKLPEAMIPAYIVAIDAIPLTPNGKVDRRALPEPESGIQEQGKLELPRDGMEERVAAIWKEVLDDTAGPIGIHDDFFELGGHSLKAAVLAGKLQQATGVLVPLSLIFELTSIAEMAAWLKERDGAAAMAEPIPKVERREWYPMSRAQRRQYMMQMLAGDATMYHVPFALRLQGKLDEVKLENVFTALIGRHESLRTTFHMTKDEFRQTVHPPYAFKLEVMDRAAFAGVETLPGELLDGAEVTKLMEVFQRPFQLDKLPLLRAGLLQLNEEDHLLLLDIHHIITDGVSSGLLVKELSQLYSGQALPELRIQYSDYAVWQEAGFANAAYAEHERYWMEIFEGKLSVLELPTDRPRPSRPSYKGRRHSFRLDAWTTAEARKLAREAKTTLYTVLLGAFAAMLAKYSGQAEVIVGTPTAGREHADTHGLIGMFVNTLALRTRPERDKTVRAYMAELHNHVVEALSRQTYPFEELVEGLMADSDRSRNPMFDAMFVLQNMDRAVMEAGGVVFDEMPFEAGTSKFDLTLEAVEREAEIELQLEYATDLFHEETARRMAESYTVLVREMCRSQERTVGELELMSESEREQLLALLAGGGMPVQAAYRERSTGRMEFRAEKGMTDRQGNAAPYSVQATSEWTGFVQEVERQAARTPDETAIQFGAETVTYAELNERANRLAHSLRAKGVGPERIVALMASRSPLLLVGILGVLKAGGAYVAIDPAYPKERIDWMLEDCGEALLLTEKAYAGVVTRAVAEWYLDDSELYAADRGNPGFVHKPDHLAYVLYTSGSTGRPKGVMIEHRGLSHFISGFRSRIPFEKGQSILAMASASFDIFVVENLLPLTLGMRIVLASEEERGDAALLQGLIDAHGVDVLQITPSRFKWWMNQRGETDGLQKLRILMIGAEPLTADVLGRLRAATGARLFNLYGPTETTVWTSIREVTEGEDISIGTPIEGSVMMVLDEGLKLQPTGVTGEICIGGPGVGRGYLSHPEWDVAFVPNPYAPGERMYRTGDLGRRLENGEFAYAGRRDFQVKIRGHRIEIGEIEQLLLRHEQVKETVVTAFQEEDGEYALCAYVVMQDTAVADAEPDGAVPSDRLTAQLREYLVNKLPSYMVPAFMVVLDAIPLTPTGKIDRRVLPTPGSADAGTRELVPLSTDTERKLAEIWKELLGTDTISAKDSFFELGGHSLKAAGMVSRIAERFGIQMPLRDIFMNPTLEGLAAHLDTSGTVAAARIPKQPEREHYPMSRAQRRQFMMGLISGGATMYHVPFAVHMQGKLDVERLEEAFLTMMRRHESLRTTFHHEEDEFRQRVHEEPVFTLERGARLRMAAGKLLTEGGDEGLFGGISALMERFIRPFDLGSLPLFRAGLIPLGEERHLLLLDFHHIITDGVSVSVLLQELTNLYGGGELPELDIQYRDYTVWQEERIGSETYMGHERYWLEAFEGELPTLALKAALPRPELQNFEGGLINFRLDEELTLKIKAFARERGTTLYTVLLGAYSMLLSKWSGEEDIIIGTPVAGRNHAQLEGLIGMFVNTVAIRSFPESYRTVSDYLSELHEDVLRALEHQDYPFEDLVLKLGIEQDRSRNPLFDTMFILQNIDRVAYRSGGIEFDPKEFDPGVSKFDLTLEAAERDEKIGFTLEYATSLFQEETAWALADDYTEIIRALVEDGASKKISAVLAASKLA